MQKVYQQTQTEIHSTAFPKNSHTFAMSDNGINYTDNVSIEPTVSSVSLGVGYLLS